MTEGLFTIYKIELFIESKDEKIKESFQIPIEVKIKSNIFFDIKIADSKEDSCLYILSKSNKILSIFNLQSKSTLIREFNNITQYDLINKDTLVIVSTEIKIVFYEITTKNNDFIQFDLINETDLASKLKFENEK